METDGTDGTDGSKAQKYHAQFRRKKTLMFDSLRLVTDYQKLKTNETPGCRAMAWNSGWAAR